MNRTPWSRLLPAAMVVAAFLAGVLPVQAADAEQPSRAKYVFLFIGDGMGAAQRTAAELFLSGPQPEEGPMHPATLAMNSLPVCGLSRTSSYDSLTTDSAASATAMATGRKTLNGALSVDPVSGAPCRTLAEIARQAGWKTGIVSTGPIDDATPAAFYAHQPTRGNHYDISMTLAASDFDYFAGGCPSGGEPEALEGRPSPVDAARRNGFRIVTSRDDLLALKPGAGKVWAMFRADPETTSMHYEIDRPEDATSLADLTRKGIELLDNPEGFFFMVEGAKIDYAGHIHDPGAAIHEVLALDRAVALALRFYREHPDDTLIIVTGDHETGGMALGSLRGSCWHIAERVAAQKMSQDAFARKVEEFREQKTPFDEAAPVIRQAFGLKELRERELEQLKDAYAESMKGITDWRGRTPEARRLYGKSDPVAVTCAHLVSDYAGIGWAAWSHTAIPVPTTAVGIGCEKFGGYYQNTAIFDKLLSAMAVRELVSQ